jgi:Bacterial protein of unknown function (DUF961).
MKLKNVAVDLKETFGNLEFGSKGEEIKERNPRTRKEEIVAIEYHLFSDVQKADDIIVVIPSTMGEMQFEYFDKVTLIEPTLKANGYLVGRQAHVDYILHAKKIVKAEEERGGQ